MQRLNIMLNGDSLLLEPEHWRASVQSCAIAAMIHECCDDRMFEKALECCHSEKNIKFVVCLRKLLSAATAKKKHQSYRMLTAKKNIKFVVCLRKLFSAATAKKTSK